MNRRAFIVSITGTLLAARLSADAQQAGKVPRIGFLSLTSPSDRPPLLDAVRQRLRELGWVEGKSIVIDYRYAEGRVDRLPDLAAELVRLKVDLIDSSGQLPPRRLTASSPCFAISCGSPRSGGTSSRYLGSDWPGSPRGEWCGSRRPRKRRF